MDAIQVADSITKPGPQSRGTVLVAASHGGRFCGYLAALAGLRGVIFNDAGVGKDNAGIGSLDYLQGHLDSRLPRLHIRLRVLAMGQICSSAGASVFAMR